MKKSRSSVPLLPARLEEGPAPPVRKEGLLATAGRPEPAPPALPAPCFVAIAVGKTHEGASFPANPMDYEYYFNGIGGGYKRTKFREASSAGERCQRKKSIKEGARFQLTCP